MEDPLYIKEDSNIDIDQSKRPFFNEKQTKCIFRVAIVSVPALVVATVIGQANDIVSFLTLQRCLIGTLLLFVLGILALFNYRRKTHRQRLSLLMTMFAIIMLWCFYGLTYLLGPSPGAAQLSTITGTVMFQPSLKPVANAMVRISGTNLENKTDMYGNFSIDNVSIENPVLCVTYHQKPYTSSVNRKGLYPIIPQPVISVSSLPSTEIPFSLWRKKTLREKRGTEQPGYRIEQFSLKTSLKLEENPEAIHFQIQCPSNVEIVWLDQNGFHDLQNEQEDGQDINRTRQWRCSLDGIAKNSLNLSIDVVLYLSVKNGDKIPDKDCFLASYWLDVPLKKN